MKPPASTCPGKIPGERSAIRSERVVELGGHDLVVLGVGQSLVVGENLFAGEVDAVFNAQQAALGQLVARSEADAVDIDALVRAVTRAEELVTESDLRGI